MKSVNIIQNANQEVAGKAKENEQLVAEIWEKIKAGVEVVECQGVKKCKCQSFICHDSMFIDRKNGNAVLKEKGFLKKQFGSVSFVCMCNSENGGVNITESHPDFRAL